MGEIRQMQGNVHQLDSEFGFNRQLVMSISRLAPSREKAGLVAGRLRGGCRETAKRMQGEQLILEGEEQPKTISLSQAFIAHARVSSCPISIGTSDIQQQKSEKNERHFGFELRSSTITAGDRSTKRRRNNPAREGCDPK